VSSPIGKLPAVRAQLRRQPALRRPARLPRPPALLLLSDCSMRRVRGQDRCLSSQPFERRQLATLPSILRDVLCLVAAPPLVSPAPPIHVSCCMHAHPHTPPPEPRHFSARLSPTVLVQLSCPSWHSAGSQNARKKQNETPRPRARPLSQCPSLPPHPCPLADSPPPVLPLPAPCTDPLSSVTFCLPPFIACVAVASAGPTLC
jgi:hypothetical protein